MYYLGAASPCVGCMERECIEVLFAQRCSVGFIASMPTVNFLNGDIIAITTVQGETQRPGMLLLQAAVSKGAEKTQDSAHTTMCNNVLRDESVTRSKYLDTRSKPPPLPPHCTTTENAPNHHTNGWQRRKDAHTDNIRPSLPASLPHHPSERHTGDQQQRSTDGRHTTNLAESLRRQRVLSSSSFCRSSWAAGARTSSSSSRLSCRPPDPQEDLRVLRASRSPPAPSARVGVYCSRCCAAVVLPFRLSLASTVAARVEYKGVQLGLQREGAMCARGNSCSLAHQEGEGRCQVPAIVQRRRRY